MKMKAEAVVIVLLGALIGASIGVLGMGKPAPKIQEMPIPDTSGVDRPQAALQHYQCPKCHMLSETAGKCPMCQSDLVGTHVLAVKEGMASCCAWPDNCKCKGLATDVTKCSCGKDVEKISVKGKYVCACADPNKCTSVSDKPGTCQCKKDMVKCE